MHASKTQTHLCQSLCNRSHAAQEAETLSESYRMDVLDLLTGHAKFVYVVQTLNSPSLSRQIYRILCTGNRVYQISVPWLTSTSCCRKPEATSRPTSHKFSCATPGLISVSTYRRTRHVVACSTALQRCLGSQQAAGPCVALFERQGSFCSQQRATRARQPPAAPLTPAAPVASDLSDRMRLELADRMRLELLAAQSYR